MRSKKEDTDFLESSPVVGHRSGIIESMQTNQEIAKVMRLIGEYLVIEEGDTSFKTRAYLRVADTITDMAQELSQVYQEGGIKALQNITGIGRAISEKIEELIKTGKLRYFEDLKKRIPIKLEELTAVDGLGPKRIAVLYKELGVKNLKQLEVAAQKGKIASLEGFGEKSQQKILKSITFVSQNNSRRLLGHIKPFLAELENRFKKNPNVSRVSIAGSARRGKETIGDIDIIAVSKNPKKVMEFFVAMPEVGHVYGSGPTKTMVRLKDGLDIDLRVVEPNAYGAALQYFTGSKEHNVKVRELANRKGYTLNEYGLSYGSAGKKGKMIASKTEEAVYKKLGLAYIEPELRENTGEIEAAQKNKLPKVIQYGSLKGDLQIQTSWTDGAHSIEEMARAAIEQGLTYIAITDHTKNLRVAGGLTALEIKKQGKEIDALNKKLRKEGSSFTILKGVECDILKDGSLDIDDKTLAELDVVGASVHSFFDLPEKEQTARILKAISNPNVDILFHPTGRKVLTREPYKVDMDVVIATCKKTRTVLEINAMPERSDLRPEYIKRAAAAGVKMAIDSDAHTKDHLQFLEYGITQARRGFATKNDIINAWPLAKLKKMLK